MNYSLDATQMQQIISMLTKEGAYWGLAIVKALIILVIGRIIIRFLNKLLRKLLEKREVDLAVQSFVRSLADISLTILLIICIIGALGVPTTSFAALLASAGLAIGMALSGNLSNFAGGLIILLFKPFKIGDYIGTSEVQGTVVDIQIFHTVLNTFDNVGVHVPNSTLSSGYINNYTRDKRRVDWTFGVEYGEDFEKVKKTILDVIAEEKRIFTEPEPFVELKELADNSVNIEVRVWVKGSDYWDVFFKINRSIYAKFNEVGIGFPFPQLTVHKAEI